MVGFEKLALRPLEMKVAYIYSTLNYFSYLGRLWSHSREITLPFFFFFGATAPSVPGPPHSRGF
jgi:hypothetical protein